MLIEVTQNDIEMGLRDNCRSCPVARALTRATGKPWQVHADRFQLDQHECDTLDAEMPGAVSDFVQEFDACRPVQPFSFEFPDQE